jgi:hypothetical protein
MENGGSALRMLRKGRDGDGLRPNVQRKRAEELKQERERWSAAAEAFQQQFVDLTKRPMEFLGRLKEGYSIGPQSGPLLGSIPTLFLLVGASFGAENRVHFSARCSRRPSAS